MNEQQTEELLTTPVETIASERAVAIRCAHWGHSGAVRPGLRWCVECGRRVEVLCLLRNATRRFELTRRPPGSGAALMDGGRFVPDAPGLYSVSIEIGGWVRDVAIVAAPEAMLDRIGPKGALYDRVIVLRSILNDPACTADTIAASMEGSNATFGLDGALLGAEHLSLKNYGR